MSREGRGVVFAVVNILARFNNTIISISDVNGNVICISSAGAGTNGFKGKKKATVYAAQRVVSALLDSPKCQGIKTVSLHVKGPGTQRDSIIKAFFDRQDLIVKDIQEKSCIAHNGVKPPKQRRV